VSQEIKPNSICATFKEPGAKSQRQENTGKGRVREGRERWVYKGAYVFSDSSHPVSLIVRVLKKTGLEQKWEAKDN